MAPRPTCSSALMSSAGARPCRCGSRMERRSTTSPCVPSATESRASFAPSSTRRPRPTPGIANLHGRQPEHALPLASRRRQRRPRLGERSGPDPVRRGGRGRLRPHDRSRRAGVAPRLCRLRDLPRPLCPRPVGGVLRPCGRRGRGCGATSSPRSSAATSGARRSGSRGSAGWRTEKPAPADDEEELPTLSELAEMLVGK
jgi:hypothetical protein